MQFLSGETYTGYEIFGPQAGDLVKGSLYLLVGLSTTSLNEELNQCFDRGKMANAREIICWPREGISSCEYPLIFCVNKNYAGRVTTKVTQT